MYVWYSRVNESTLPNLAINEANFNLYPDV